MQSYNGNEARLCNENAEAINDFNAKTQSLLESLQDEIKATGLGKFVKDFEVVMKNWNEGLLKSHNATAELYELAGKEFKATFERFGIEEV